MSPGSRIVSPKSLCSPCAGTPCDIGSGLIALLGEQAVDEETQAQRVRSANAQAELVEREADRRAAEAHAAALAASAQAAALLAASQAGDEHRDRRSRGSLSASEGPMADLQTFSSTFILSSCWSRSRVWHRNLMKSYEIHCNIMKSNDIS